jgi:hypothetical protein
MMPKSEFGLLRKDEIIAISGIPLPSRPLPLVERYAFPYIV